MQAPQGWALRAQCQEPRPAGEVSRAPVSDAPAGSPPFSDLTPTLEVEGQALVMLTPLMAAVPRNRLGKPLGNLHEQADDITRALDILLMGF